ncbi:hypothetical protein Hanom_Chr02g00148711 [Helianthus anomalus]
MILSYDWRLGRKEWGAANLFHRIGNGRQTNANPFVACMFDEMGVKSVRQHRCGEERKERERGGCGVGSIPISTNHIFFFFFYLKSLPLHQIFKLLPTLFSIV